MKEPIIIFDGSCNICSKWVSMLNCLDKRAVLHYYPYQSLAGQELIKKYGVANIDSVFFIDNGIIYIKSEAVVQALKKLGRLKLLYPIFSLLPLSIKDKIYDLIARNRHKLFGSSSCPVSFD